MNSPRFNSDDAYVGTRIANVLAILAGAGILFFFLRSAFLAAVPAISRVAGREVEHAGK